MSFPIKVMQMRRRHSPPLHRHTAGNGMEVANYYSALPGNRGKRKNVVRGSQTSSDCSGHLQPHQKLHLFKTASCPSDAETTKTLRKVSWKALTAFQVLLTT